MQKQMAGTDEHERLALSKLPDCEMLAQSVEHVLLLAQRKRLIPSPELCDDNPPRVVWVCCNRPFGRFTEKLGALGVCSSQIQSTAMVRFQQFTAGGSGRETDLLFDHAALGGGDDHTFSLYLRRDSSSASWIDTKGTAGSVLVIREG